MTFQFFNGFYMEYIGIRSISIPHRDYYNIDEIVVPVIDQIFSVHLITVEEKPKWPSTWLAKFARYFGIHHSNENAKIKRRTLILKIILRKRY